MIHHNKVFPKEWVIILVMTHVTTRIVLGFSVILIKNVFIHWGIKISMYHNILRAIDKALK